ncbi:hypothetical protein JL721_3128 [Aureococcus anophagefferens]|nr:hypothetical protein JL721_3128 [Aureococcus anophagefferens]
MVRSTGTITRATKDVTCSGEELDTFVGDVAVVRSRGRFWVTLGVRLVTFGPSIVYVFPMFFGLLGEGRCKSCAIAVVEGGACCSSCIGLPVGLALFAVLFVLSIGLADFCFLGPAAVLTGGNEDNRYLAYYLRCEGSNPISVDVDAMANAVDELDEYADELELAGVCTGLDAAASDIDGAIGDLQDVVDEITEDVLSCRYIQPIVGDLFYDAVCDRTVEGSRRRLYRVWVVVLASGAAALCGLFVAPLATAAFRGADHRDHDRELRRSYLEVVEKGEVVKVRSSLQRAVDAARGSLRRAKVVPIVAEPLDAAEAPPITAEPAARAPGIPRARRDDARDRVRREPARGRGRGRGTTTTTTRRAGDDDGLRAEDVDDADGDDDGLRAEDVDDADSDRGRGDDDHTDSSSGSANDSDDDMDEDDERNLDPVDAERAPMVEAEQARLRRMDGDAQDSRWRWGRVVVVVVRAGSMTAAWGFGLPRAGRAVVGQRDVDAPAVDERARVSAGLEVDDDGVRREVEVQGEDARDEEGPAELLERLLREPLGHGALGRLLAHVVDERLAVRCRGAAMASAAKALASARRRRRRAPPPTPREASQHNAGSPRAGGSASPSAWASAFRRHAPRDEQ